MKVSEDASLSSLSIPWTIGQEDRHTKERKNPLARSNILLHLLSISSEGEVGDEGGGGGVKAGEGLVRHDKLGGGHLLIGVEESPADGIRGGEVQANPPLIVGREGDVAHIPGIAVHN